MLSQASPHTTTADELVARYDVAGPRYTSYPTADTWGDGVGPDDFSAALEQASDATTTPLSLYVHLPFCRSLCLYCGCNVVVAKRSDVADPYLANLAGEMDLVAERLGRRRRVTQLHWGGGTPTFLDEARLARLFCNLTQRFDLRPGAEIAIEIDPRVTNRRQLRLLHQLGFNRVSLGVQDVNPNVQQAIGRQQTMAQTCATLDDARDIGFASVSFDLIYGLPQQTRASWARTIDTICALSPDRLAIYSFAHLPALRPQQRRLRVDAMPNGVDKLTLLLDAHAALEEAGYVAIGMDHFARPGDELARAAQQGTVHRNFQGYTVQTASDVIGLGVTGISDLGGQLFAQNQRDLTAYGAAIASGSLATARGIHLRPMDRLRRRLINALMCNLHVSLGPEEHALLGREIAALDPLARDGLVRVDRDSVVVTATGRPFLRNIAMVFDEHRWAKGGVPSAGSRTI
jgi:oxygen-independent coproporphyrinogen III oxidase